MDNNKDVVGPDTGLTCLVMLARFHGVAAEADQLRHQFGQTEQHFGPTEILRATKLLGLKARQIKSEISRLDRVQLPAIARHTDGHYFIIGGLKEESGVASVLIQDPLEQRPQILPRDEFEKQWSGELILITKRASLLNGDRKFDFKRFIPAI